MSDSLEDQILEQIGVPPLEDQRRVLEFAWVLATSTPAGTPGRELLRFGDIFDEDDERGMAEAAEDSFEKTDPNERHRARR